MQPYFEQQQKFQQERIDRLSREASHMSTSDLLRSLSWQQSLSEHADETGTGNPSAHKLNVIQNELRSRGIR